MDTSIFKQDALAKKKVSVLADTTLALSTFVQAQRVGARLNERGLAGILCFIFLKPVTKGYFHENNRIPVPCADHNMEFVRLRRHEPTEVLPVCIHAVPIPDTAGNHRQQHSDCLFFSPRGCQHGRRGCGVRSQYRRR